jgi:hypothetical protein
VKFLKDLLDIMKVLRANDKVLDFDPVGSAVYMEEAKDLDVLVLYDAPSFLTDARWAFGPDWYLCAGEYSDTDESWGAIRKGAVNLIITVDRAWYDGMLKASRVCEALGLQDKGDRIIVHRIVRDGYDATDATARRDGTR